MLQTYKLSKTPLNCVISMQCFNTTLILSHFGDKSLAHVFRLPARIKLTNIHTIRPKTRPLSTEPKKYVALVKTLELNLKPQDDLHQRDSIQSQNTEEHRIRQGRPCRIFRLVVIYIRNYSAYRQGI
jgi:hypothetical protein